MSTIWRHCGLYRYMSSSPHHPNILCDDVVLVPVLVAIYVETKDLAHICPTGRPCAKAQGLSSSITHVWGNLQLNQPHKATSEKRTWLCKATKPRVRQYPVYRDCIYRVLPYSTTPKKKVHFLFQHLKNHVEDGHKNYPLSNFDLVRNIDKILFFTFFFFFRIWLKKWNKHSIQTPQILHEDRIS